jgi:hypothetical protein
MLNISAIRLKFQISILNLNKKYFVKQKMDWLIIISNIAFALIATLLSVLGWRTLKNIRYLNVGKSFWIPIVASGLLFAITSIITILNETVLSLTITVEIGQITQLIAFCFLSVGIYSYSRMIRKNLPDKYIVPEANSTQYGKMEAYIAPTQSVEKKTKTSKNLGIEISSECNHQLGYLRTFPTNSSLPEECLSCNRIMECKQS